MSSFKVITVGLLRREVMIAKVAVSISDLAARYFAGAHTHTYTRTHAPDNKDSREDVRHAHTMMMERQNDKDNHSVKHAHIQYNHAPAAGDPCHPGVTQKQGTLQGTSHNKTLF